ncbi:SusC/RagA family TonB-linked outer membrane protein [Thermophagus sp. OGC60D27]|uniref:SusC/RagA family TonB-linked outer membrane protein n=1 Tax=Thermophagus sp. OGC60D27 TaxID=3458415 RepID=UPI004037EF48
MTIKKTLLFIGILCSCINMYGIDQTPSSYPNKIIQEDGIRISGTVVDSEKNPLVGVNIRLKENPSVGTVTDVNGHFYMEVPSKESVLLISYISFKDQEIRVGSQINFYIILEEEISNLEEIVVTGYGHQKKMSVIGSIETVNPQVMQSGSTRSISNNLAGQVAGIIAVKRSGEPGYDNSNFWIRGISSFSGNQNPLVLIDGIERDLNNIDPSEIESFSVLKDASASAMYGVRGANGVIVINTKRGKIGAPSVNVRFEQSISEPTKLPEFVGAVEYMQLLNELKEDKTQLPYSQEEIYRTYTGYDRDLYPDVNWLDEITKDYAYSSRANMSVSGGSDFLRYSLVGSYFNEKGILETDKTLPYDTGINLDRYNMRANVDIDITNSTTLRMNIGGYLQKRRGQNSSTDNTFAAAFTTSPMVHPARYSDGTIPLIPYRTNPWAMATQNGYYIASSSQIQSLFSIEQDLKAITQGLKAKLMFSFDSYSNSRMIRPMTPTYHHVASGREIDGSLIHGIYKYGDDALGHYTESGYGTKNVYFESTLTYHRLFNQLHDVDALFLYNQQSFDNGSFQPYRKQGIAGRVSYMFNRRYIAEFNFGYNGSENFDKGSRFGFFPSVAVGWLISEEPFLAYNQEAITKLKIRGSVGKAGNDDIGGRRFAYMTTIFTGTNGYDWGDTSQIGREGITEGEIGVNDLTWETALKYNVGFELGLWSELDFHFDLFREKRSNIFMQRNIIPSQTGFITNPWANFGKVTNEGLEFSLTYNKEINQDWWIGFRGNFTYAKNRIDEIDEPDAVKGTHRSITGKSMNTLWGLEAVRLFTADDFEEDGSLKSDIPTHSVGSAQVRPGDIMYKDQNGDNAITDEDEGYIGGTVDPRMVYGFGGNIKYKNWDFNYFFQGVGDTYRIIGGSTYFLPGSGQGLLGNIYKNYTDRWTEDNPSQDVFWPRLYENPNKHNYRASTWWKKDISFLRCKLLELGYTLPKKFTGKAGIKSTRLYVSGNDLFYFSKFKMWDPELNTSDGLKYPGMRSLMFGIDINF